MPIVSGGHDGALTALRSVVAAGVMNVSGPPCKLGHMNDDSVDTVIRQAIGGDPGATRWILARADTTESTVVVAMAALLERLPARLERALAAASTSRDRQVVAIARAHLGGNSELVDALARDHLVDFPDSLIVAWIASDAVERARSRGPL